MAVHEEIFNVHLTSWTVDFRVEEHVLCLDKFFDCEQSDCVGKLGDAQSTLSNRFDAASSSQDGIKMHCWT